jgi:hypothetical protein
MQNRFPTIDRIHTGAILTEIGERLRIYLSEDQTELPGGATRRPVGASRNDKQEQRVSRLRDACILRLTRPLPQGTLVSLRRSNS